MFQIDKTEAINRVMMALDGTLVSNLSTPGNDTVIQAIRALEIATEKTQIENTWNFNLDGPRQLTADNNSVIAIPTNYLEVRFLSWSSGSVWDLTVKDHQVYNRRAATNVVPGQVSVAGSVLVPYDDCPAAVQNYIIERTKVEFIGESMQLSAQRAQIYAQQARDAYMALEKWDSQQKSGMMDSYPSMRDSIRGRNTGWWGV